MTRLGAYAAVLALPVVARVLPEPVGFWWGYKQARLRTPLPLPPLPPELKERSDRNYRYLLLLKSALLCMCIYLLMQRYSVPKTAVGLRLHHWALFLLVGVGAAATDFALKELIRMIAGRLAGRAIPYQAAEYLTRGSTTFWILINFVTCFAEELWRAFGLVGLLQVNHGALFAIAGTTLAFAHAGNEKPVLFELGRICAPVVSGAFFALLFLWSRSIVSTYTGHLLINFLAFYRARKTKAT